MKRNEEQKCTINRVIERVDWVFGELCDCQHELENCGCKAQWKKLDTITGKVENLLHELYDISQKG